MGCVHKAGCGWCGEKGTCIEGNKQGPLLPCLRSTFLYNAPSPEWNPIKAGHINIMAVDRNGLPMTEIVPEPNFARADVNNPYALN